MGMNPVATANSFTALQVSSMTFGHETVTYTFGPQNLPTGSTTIFSATAFNRGVSPTKQAILTRIASTQSAGVNLYWSHDGKTSDSSQGYADAMPSGMQFIDVFAPAVSTLGLFADNNSGAAIANWQCTYTVDVRDLTVAEKLFYGYALSEEDRSFMEAIRVGPNEPPSLEQLQAAVDEGTYPIDFATRTIDALYRNRRVATNSGAVPRHFVVGSSGSDQLVIRVDPGTVQVLRGLAVLGSPAITVLVNRDDQAFGGDTGYVAVNGAAFTQVNGFPLPYRLFARQYMQIQVIGAAGTYLVQPIMQTLNLSSLLADHLRVSTFPIGSPSSPAAQRFAKVRAGWR